MRKVVFSGLLVFLVVYTALIVYFSLLTEPTVSTDPGDFSLHLVVYFFYGFLCYLTLSNFIPKGKNIFATIFIFSTLDFSLEILQPFFGRHCDLIDAMLGFAGGCLGLVYSEMLLILLSTRNLQRKNAGK